MRIKRRFRCILTALLCSVLADVAFPLQFSLGMASKPRQQRKLPEGAGPHAMAGDGDVFNKRGRGESRLPRRVFLSGGATFVYNWLFSIMSGETGSNGTPAAFAAEQAVRPRTFKVLDTQVRVFQAA